MKKKIPIVLILLACVFLLGTCDLFGTIIDTVKGTSVLAYFDSNGNPRSAVNARNSVSGSNIEFYVTNLLVNCDTDNVGVWLIGDFGNGKGGGRTLNIGWWDIEGINSTRVVTGDRNAAPHSTIKLSIRGIKIDGVVYSVDQNTGAATISTDNFIKENMGGFDIWAGDPSKRGHEYFNPSAPNLPWAGVSDFLKEVKEFIVVVDEEKLHTDGVPNADWWECFSFVTR